MSSFGVINEGFRRKLFETIKAEIETDQKNLFGNEFNTAADSVAGQLNGVFADQLADLWELAEAVYSSGFPNSAGGASLRNLGLLTGVVELEAAPTTVDVIVTSAAGTTINIGDTIVASNGTTYRAETATVIPAATDTTVEFKADTDGPISAPAGTVFKTPSTGGIDDTPAVILATVGETYDLTTSPTFTVEMGGRSPQAIVLSGGAAESAADTATKINESLIGGTASDVGGFIQLEVDTGNAGTLSNTVKITTDTLFGFPLDDVKFGRPANEADGKLGRNTETDAEFRIRRQQLLSLAGASTLNALLSAVSSVEDVLFVSIIENDTDGTSPAPDSLPPHSFEVVVEGGTDVAIAEAIFNDKPIGIQAYSGAAGGDKISETVFDSQNNSHLIEFSRPTTLAVTDVDITLTYDGDYGGGDPAAGDLAVKEALDSYIESLTPGDDIIYQKFLCAALDVVGVVDVTAFTYDIGGGPITVNTAVDNRTVADLDQVDIDVSSAAA